MAWARKGASPPFLGLHAQPATPHWDPAHLGLVPLEAHGHLDAGEGAQPVKAHLVHLSWPSRWQQYGIKRMTD